MQANDEASLDSFPHGNENDHETRLHDEADRLVGALPRPMLHCSISRQPPLSSSGKDLGPRLSTGRDHWTYVAAAAIIEVQPNRYFGRVLDTFRRNPRRENGFQPETVPRRMATPAIRPLAAAGSRPGTSATSSWSNERCFFLDVMSCLWPSCSLSPCTLPSVPNTT